MAKNARKADARGRSVSVAPVKNPVVPVEPTPVAVVATEEKPSVVAVKVPSARTARVWRAGARDQEKALMPNHFINIDRQSTIHLIVTSPNPKKRTPANRYALYEEGGTVARYIERVVARNLGTARVCLQDLAWDVNHGFITVTEPYAHEAEDEAELVAAVAEHDLEMDDDSVDAELNSVIAHQNAAVAHQNALIAEQNAKAAEENASLANLGL